MKDIADDLLDDLEELEYSSSQLESNVESVIKNQETLDKFSGESAMQSAVFMLEASKLAQDSAVNSQLAAEINLKITKEQKMQIDELHDVNNSWRQSMRTATQEIKGSRSFFIGMLITAIVTGVIISALIAGMLFKSSQDSEQLKSELTDILQTEITLNHRQTTMKIDELASIIELLGSESGVKSSGAFKLSQPSIEDTQNNTAIVSSKNRPTDGIENLSIAEIDYERLQKLVTNALNEQKAIIENWLKEIPTATESKEPVVIEAKIALPTNVVEMSQGETSKAEAPQIDKAQIDLSAIEVHFEKIDTQLKHQLNQLAIIKKQLDSKAATTLQAPAPVAAKTAPAVVKPSTPKASAAVDDIQEKRLAEREKATNAQFAAIRKQLDVLQAKQDEINKSLVSVNKGIQNNQKAIEDKDSKQPYSYRNPYEYKQ